MKKTNKLGIVMAVFILIFCFAGCGDNSNKSNKNADSKASTSSAESYFEWRENRIIGLTDQGEKQTSLVIPANCEGFDGLAFYEEGNSAEEVSFESNKDIELERIFSNSKKIKKITLPSELGKIGDKEFSWCIALESINIPANVEDIGAYAFQYNTSLETVNFKGEKVINISAHAFEGCESLKSIKLPDSITKIDEYGFFKCNELESVTLPKDVREIGAFAFAGNGLTDIYVPEEVELSAYDATSFTQTDHTVTIHVYENSWMDQNFELVFDNTYEKVYITE